MTKRSSNRRMAENEVIFRQYNESVQSRLNELKKIAKEDNQQAFVQDGDDPLYFYCECSDENCQKRILMKPSEYNQIHRKRDRFIVIPGHEADSIESVTWEGPKFSVVKKLVYVPERADHLHPTEVDNS